LPKSLKQACNATTKIEKNNVKNNIRVIINQTINKILKGSNLWSLPVDFYVSNFLYRLHASNAFFTQDSECTFLLKPPTFTISISFQSRSWKHEFTKTSLSTSSSRFESFSGSSPYPIKSKKSTTKRELKIRSDLDLLESPLYGSYHHIEIWNIQNWHQIIDELMLYNHIHTNTSINIIATISFDPQLVVASMPIYNDLCY